MHGRLVEDPDAVAAALNSVLSSGVPPRKLGLDMERGHRLTAKDVVATNRAMIEFQDEASSK